MFHTRLNIDFVFFVTACGYHDPQQSFDPAYTSIDLRYSLCSFWSRRRLGEMPRLGLRPHSLCVMHEEVQKLLLDCLSAEPFWNLQQYLKINFLRYHSHRASGGLNKNRLISAKQLEWYLKVLFNFFRKCKKNNTSNVFILRYSYVEAFHQSFKRKGFRICHAE